MVGRKQRVEEPLQSRLPCFPVIPAHQAHGIAALLHGRSRFPVSALELSSTLTQACALPAGKCHQVGAVYSGLVSCLGDGLLMPLGPVSSGCPGGGSIGPFHYTVSSQLSTAMTHTLSSELGSRHLHSRQLKGQSKASVFGFLPGRNHSV